MTSKSQLKLILTIFSGVPQDEISLLLYERNQSIYSIIVYIKTLEYTDSTCWPKILVSPYCVQYYCDLTYFLLFIVVTMRLKTKVLIGFLCLSSIVIQCQSCIKAFTSIDNLPQPRYYGTHYKVSNNIAL